MALSDRTTRVMLIGVPAAFIALLVIAGMVREARSEARNRSDAPETPVSL
jgi:choline-glycine betaine transporter